VFQAGVLDNRFDLIDAEGDRRGVVAAARWASKMRDGAAEKDIGGFTVQVFKREADKLLLWRHIWN
jgi:hypothetical protein